jgi:hypothetical protein
LILLFQQILTTDTVWIRNDAYQTLSKLIISTNATAGGYITVNSPDPTSNFEIIDLDKDNAKDIISATIYPDYKIKWVNIKITISD